MKNPGKNSTRYLYVFSKNYITTPVNLKITEAEMLIQEPYKFFEVTINAFLNGKQHILKSNIVISSQCYALSILSGTWSKKCVTMESCFGEIS